MKVILSCHPEIPSYLWCKVLTRDLNTMTHPVFLNCTLVVSNTPQFSDVFLPLQEAAGKSGCQFSVPHIFLVYLVLDTVEENLEVVALSSLKEKKVKSKAILLCVYRIGQVCIHLCRGQRITLDVVLRVHQILIFF